MKCSKCGVEDKNLFYKDNTHKNSWLCKDCMKKYLKEKRKFLKFKCVNIKGSKCSKCGYDRNYAALEFHHAKDDKMFNLCNLSSYSWDDIQNELKKCVLLCANCHSEEHNKLYNSSCDFEFDHESSFFKKKRGYFKAKIAICEVCGTKINSPKNKQRFCSLRCSAKKRQTAGKPDCETLKNLINKMSLEAAGRVYGVSGNTVKQWAKNYKISKEECDNGSRHHWK
jgi:hypothetical protein